MENDRPPSFQGAPRQKAPGQSQPDGWALRRARFLELVLNLGTPLRGSLFPSFILPSGMLRERKLGLLASLPWEL